MRIDPKTMTFDLLERAALLNALRDREGKLVALLRTRRTGRDALASELAYVQDCINRVEFA